ncbi:two-component sensor histidine kinase [Beggiatoa sp. PS]|nr:two-component sensor histidine kinase [Beggiatoa sp. PS]
MKKKPVILCIDDEKILLMGLRQQLKNQVGKEYRIEIAQSGEDALEIIEELQEDDIELPLVISDQIMPGIKGDQLLVQIHAILPKTLKILLTGQAEPDAVGNAINNANLYRYITKPWEPADLNLTVIEALRRYYQEQELAEFYADLETKVVERTREVQQQNEVIIEERAAKEAILQANKEIEAQKQALAKTLQELRSTQQQLINSEKMAALGQLIAGIAHEINTPLGVIRSSVHNISRFLVDTLEQLPNFFQLLTKEQQRDFFILFKQSIQHKNSSLSSKEKRQYRRTLVRQLEAYAINKATDIADTLVEIGIYHGKDIESFLPLLKLENSQLILKMAYQLAALNSNTQTITLASERANKIVFALKSFAHYDQSGEKIKINIVDSIETVLVLYHNQIKDKIEVIKNYADLPLILCYPDELNQVWTNLIHNALQAMTNKGALQIDITMQNNYVIVGITDSGQGIPEDIQAKIFEPFFTTKPPGEGSGLGLDIVCKIIDKHQGKIEMKSQPGKTTFKILLPIRS